MTRTCSVMSWTGRDEAHGDASCEAEVLDGRDVMDAGDYRIAWIVYCLAASGLAWLCWLVLRKLGSRGLAWLLQCWLLALLFTPWYVVPDDTLMAPALMVFVMDAITVSGESAVRALVPLIMTLCLGVLVTLVLLVARGFWRRRS